MFFGNKTMELSNKWFILFLTGATVLMYYTGNAYPIDNKYHQKMLTDKFHKHLLKGIMSLNVTEFVIVGQRRMNNNRTEVFWSGGSTKSNQSERNTDNLLDIILNLTNHMMNMSPGESSINEIQNAEDVAASKTVLIPQETEKHESERIPVAETMTSPQPEINPMPVSSPLVRHKPEKSNNGETNINEKAVQDDSQLSSVYEVDLDEQYSLVYENTLSHAALNQTESEEGNFKTSNLLLWCLLLIYAVIVTILHTIHYCVVSSTKPKILSSNSDTITV